MDDDFNISPALAALFKFTHRINTVMDQSGLSASDRETVLKTLERIDSVLAVMDLEAPGEDKAVDALIQRREAARKGKNWATADALRQELKNMGVEIIDTKEGPVWRRLKLSHHS
jgi:cysteinyl-tRNA synthetase